MIIREDAIFKPTKGNIVVELDLSSIDQKDGFWNNDELFDYIDENGVLVYTAKVVAVSPDDDDSVKVGDNVMFNSMAGSHLATLDSLKKVIPVKTALAKIDVMSNDDVVNMAPLFDRVLVEVIDVDNDGIIAGSDAKDPRLTSMTYAKVLKVGPDVLGSIKEGDVVGIEYSVGEILRRGGIGQSEIRAMSELYVSVVIEQ
jgi:co-chaperonin GroES (HSP10)